MKTVGAGVNEIRIRDATGAYRVIYLATRPEAVYVLHCFQKKTEKTGQHDIDLAKTRLKAIPKSPRKWAMKKRTHNEHGPGHVTPAGRSVFYDLGFDEAEARVLEMRADLIAALRDHIQKKGATDIFRDIDWWSLWTVPLRFGSLSDVSASSFSSIQTPRWISSAWIAVLNPVFPTPTTP
jgi:hypothetical protein